MRQRLMKVLRCFLFVGWTGFIGMVILCFVFSKSMGYVLRPIADFFVLIPAALLVVTALYFVIHLYDAGVKTSGS
jgi:hypothetical protein